MRQGLTEVTSELWIDCVLFVIKYLSTTTPFGVHHSEVVFKEGDY
jgi:hypothetical protein